MNCIRSFNFVTLQNQTLSGANIDTWVVGGQNYWSANLIGSSTFDVQGFKNINIHSVEALGSVFTTKNLGFSAIVQDWQFFIKINGYSPLVSGKVRTAPNDFAIDVELASPDFSLSRYNPKLEFAEPIASALSIELYGLQASGYGAESLLSINLAWDMNFIIYYSYEGE